MNPSDYLCVALDVPTLEQAKNIAGRLEGIIDWYKIGIQLFTREGPLAVREISRYGRVFLDLKYHDVPSPVCSAVRNACSLEVDLLSIHASGSNEMLSNAVYGCWEGGEIHGNKPLLLGVTELTSEKRVSKDEVYKLADKSMRAGLDGYISPGIFKKYSPELFLVTPGIRLEKSKPDDQKQKSTPRQALLNGSDLLVVGRPIIQSLDCEKAANVFLDRISEIL